MYICISSSRYVLTHALFLPCKSRRCRQRLQGYVVPVVKILRLGGVCLLDSTVNMFIYVQDSKMGYKYNTRIVKSSAVGFFFSSPAQRRCHPTYSLFPFHLALRLHFYRPLPLHLEYSNNREGKYAESHSFACIWRSRKRRLRFHGGDLDLPPEMDQSTMVVSFTLFARVRTAVSARKIAVIRSSKHRGCTPYLTSGLSRDRTPDIELPLRWLLDSGCVPQRADLGVIHFAYRCTFVVGMW